MQGAIEATDKEVRETILRHVLSTSDPVLVTGPNGSGKSHLLRSVSASLSDHDVQHFIVEGTDPDAGQRIEQLPPGALTLVDDCEFASSEALRAMAERVAAGSNVLATITESSASTGYGERMRRLHERFPEARSILERIRPIRLEPLSDDQIARLVHRASPEPLSSVTVAAIQQLSWGLPGAALTLLQLHRSGSLSSTPRPKILRTHASDLHLSTLHHPIRMAEAQLTSEQIAAAVVLSEIGPRSRSGIADVFGAETQSRLFDSGLLLPHPDSPGLFGVPGLYAAAVRSLTTPDTLGRVRQSTATHLLSQEAYGIPLPDHEAIFCAGVLSRNDRSIASDPLLSEQHASFLKRVIGDLVNFGEGARARDLLLRLGQQGPGLCPLARARLVTVLRDAHVGLQSLLGATPPHGNCDLPPTEPEKRIAAGFLRSNLAAEVGLPFEPDPDITPDAPEWSDAQLVIRRWHDAEPLAEDAPELLRIARTHPRPEISLLAQQLLSFEAALNGVRYRSFNVDDVEPRIARLAVHASESLRDVLSTAVVAQSVIRFFSPGLADDAPRLRNLVDRLPGSSRHRIWLTHLFAARTAFLHGDLTRSLLEWEGFADHLPRFIAFRLTDFIRNVSHLSFDQDQNPQALRLYSTQVLIYFSGQLDSVRAEAFADPASPAGRARIGSGDPGEFEALPHQGPIRAHLEALRAQNPAALLRAAESLESLGYRAPAAYALREARRIFLRRRASGSVTATDARLAALRTGDARSVPWFNADAISTPPRERLTPRETVTAQLAAEGLSNREIAERMRCSVRTVESHLAQARAKLGVSSREAMKARLGNLISGEEARKAGAGAGPSESGAVPGSGAGSRPGSPLAGTRRR